jgi:hypothetical protein
VRLRAVFAKEQLASGAPASGVGRVGLVVTVITLGSWARATRCSHSGEHHPIGRQRGGSAAERVAAVGNWTTLAVATGCAPTAHVVQAPGPLQQCKRGDREQGADSSLEGQSLQLKGQYAIEGGLFIAKVLQGKTSRVCCKIVGVGAGHKREESRVAGVL